MAGGAGARGGHYRRRRRLRAREERPAGFRRGGSDIAPSARAALRRRSKRGGPRAEVGSGCGFRRGARHGGHFGRSCACSSRLAAPWPVAHSNRWCHGHARGSRPVVVAVPPHAGGRRGSRPMLLADGFGPRFFFFMQLLFMYACDAMRCSAINIGSFVQPPIGLAGDFKSARIRLERICNFQSTVQSTLCQRLQVGSR